MTRSTNRALTLLASTMLTATAGPALAQQAAEGSQLEEIIVTAQKRAEDLQSVPISVQAIGEKRLDELQVNDFTDYVKFLPSVAFHRDSPGFTKIYMRGVASGENGNHSGPLPSVGVYLDETPVTTITGPLEFHIYDVSRVESLAGPQGTLYGASSQAGTIRIITNKPSTDGFSAAYDLEGNKVGHGDFGYSAEGYVNVPLGDRMAVRLVAWGEHDAGFIDNVPGTRTYPTGNITINNNAAVEDDYNEVDTIGARAALKIDLTDSWTVTPSIMAQRTEADGLFAYDPNVGDLKVTHFYPELQDDKWAIAALTVEGKVSDLDIVYAGSYLRRWNRYEQDYSDYSYFYDTLFGYGAYIYDDLGRSINTSQYIQAKDYYTKQSHEFRVSTTFADRFKVLGGLFYEKQTHNIQQRYRIDNLASVLEVPGWFDTIWLTKQLRTDRDYAAFADATFDVNDKLSITGGIRFFRVKNSLQGYFGFGPGFSSTTGVSQCFSPTPIVRGGPCTNLDKTTKENGHTYRVNAEYRVDPGKMVYVTYSTGYRPGGINRRGNLPPYESDFLKNLEFGWKTSWADNTVRWNGAVYYDKWDDFQFSFLGQNGLTEIRNANSAKSTGVETEVNWLVAEGFTINGSASYTDAKLTEPYCANIRVDPTCVEAPKGQALPLTSKFKGNVVARYEWDLASGMRAHVQGAAVVSGPFWPDLRTIERNIEGKVPGYTTFDLAAGVKNDSWRIEAYIKNLTDKLGQTGRFAECAIQVCGAQTYRFPIQPRTFGIRFGQSF
jgi:outer membrane receptor protein involved in Fe transport